MPIDLEAAVRQLFELAALQALPHLTERRAELRAEHRQIRLDAQLRRLDIAELDLLHAQLLRDLVDMPACERGTGDDEPPQRLPVLQL